MFMHFSCICTFFSLSYWYWSVLGTLLFLSLSLFFFQLVCSMTPKKSKSTSSRNPLRSRASSSDSNPFHIRFHDGKARKDFSKNFHDKAFIWNTKLSYRTFLILAFPLSSTVGVGSHFVASRSLVPLWSYKSFTPICTHLITLYLISSLAYKVRAL